VRASLSASFVIAIAVAPTACRQEQRPTECLPERGVEAWVERRFPSTVELADTAFASLSLSIARDSANALQAGSMISVIIAGPSSAAFPDTVRVLASERTLGSSLWRGDQLRAGAYTASLSAPGQGAGPRSFSLAPGERVEVEARLRQTARCDRDSTGSR
jgi:hypothetical protein